MHRFHITALKMITRNSVAKYGEMLNKNVKSKSRVQNSEWRELENCYSRAHGQGLDERPHEAVAVPFLNCSVALSL